MGNKHMPYDLAQMQSLPLEAKIVMTQQRIRQWYDYWDGQVYVSFSGGKDSTYVLYKLVKEYRLKVKAYTLDNGFLSQEAREIESVAIIINIAKSLTVFFIFAPPKKFKIILYIILALLKKILY